jgi:signal transduction histidine kinase
MNKFHHGLRFKLAMTFAIFGATISILLSLGLSLITHRLGENLMDETLRAEIDGYISRRARNPNALLPATISIQGYLLAPGKNSESIPSELVTLGSGTYRLNLNDISYRVAVEDKNGERYFMLFNEERQREREQMFTMYLALAAITMTIISSWAGWWLAGRGVAPISELARRVSRADPGDDTDAVAQGFSIDEIGQLAQVFSAYLKRMRDFINRERNFTSDVSHELRTPLTIVQGVLELMEDDKQLLEKQQERIAKIGRANTDMVNLTQALLLMARESNDAIDIQTCDVNKVVSVSIETNRHLISKNTQIIVVSHSHANIEAERTLLSIVVSNLIRNAYTFTPSGTVSILVEENSVTVKDTGTGIRSEEIGKVFQKHFKGSGSPGSGIGLSLVKRICERYGWEIIILSTEGQGTTAQLIFQSDFKS